MEKNRLVGRGWIGFGRVVPTIEPDTFFAMNSSLPTPPPMLQNIILYGIWAALFSALFFYKIFLGAEGLAEETVEGFPVMAILVVGSLVVAVVIRFFVLPRLKVWQKFLVGFVFGIAIAQAGAFYTLFLLPASLHTPFYVLPVFGVLIYCPYFLSRPWEVKRSAFEAEG